MSSVPTANIEALMTALVAAVAAVPGVREARLFPGEFDEAASKKFMAASPAVWIGFKASGRTSFDDTGSMLLDLTMIAVVADKSTGRAQPEIAGLALAVSVAGAIGGQSFAIPGVSRARDLRLENIATPGLIGMGLALYGIEWTQPVRLATSLVPPEAAIALPTVIRDRGLPGAS